MRRAHLSLGRGLAVWLVAGVACGSGVGALWAQHWTDSESLTQSEKAARACVEGFFEVFNRADNHALQSYLNYPHAFVGRNGTVAIVDDRWDMGFDGLREREGWARSDLIEVEPLLVGEDKVHYRVQFSRSNSSGEVYREMEGLWIVTRQDGAWGVTLRSY